jgi:hypothetical protein
MKIVLMIEGLLFRGESTFWYNIDTRLTSVVIFVACFGVLKITNGSLAESVGYVVKAKLCPSDCG